MSDFDPEAIFHRLMVAGEDWTDKDAAACMLEETKKTLLAELMTGFSGSNAERERQALADAAYKHHIKTMVAARKEANRAKVRYDSTKVLAEMRRTEASTKRAEMMLR